MAPGARCLGGCAGWDAGRSSIGFPTLTGVNNAATSAGTGSTSPFTSNTAAGTAATAAGAAAAALRARAGQCKHVDARASSPRPRCSSPSMTPPTSNRCTHARLAGRAGFHHRHTCNGHCSTKRSAWSLRPRRSTAVSPSRDDDTTRGRTPCRSTTLHGSTQRCGRATNGSASDGLGESIDGGWFADVLLCIQGPTRLCGWAAYER